MIEKGLPEYSPLSCSMKPPLSKIKIPAKYLTVEAAFSFSPGFEPACHCVIVYPVPFSWRGQKSYTFKDYYHFHDYLNRNIS